MVELQYNLPTKVVQTDGGGEFRHFTQFLTNLGIQHRLTCPHTHHQNGYVERKHRHIVETGLTLLAHAKLPLYFWDHAFLTTTYLFNRLPSPTLDNKSPFFMLHLQFTDYKFLKCFGCACFPFTRPYNAHKLEFHSKECVFLGYSPSHKGYKCLDPSGKMFISKDVIFNEQRFPYIKLFSTDPSSSIDCDSPILPTSFPTVIPTTAQPTATPVNTTTTSAHSFSQVSPATSSLHTIPSHSGHYTTPPLSAAQSRSSSTNHHDLPPGPILNPIPINTLSPSTYVHQSLSPNASAGNSASSAEHSANSTSPHMAPHRIHPNNTHTMATRGKHGIVQKRLHLTLLLTHTEPTTYKQAMKHLEWT